MKINEILSAIVVSQTKTKLIETIATVLTQHSRAKFDKIHQLIKFVMRVKLSYEK